jgi:hypothetical protein
VIERGHGKAAVNTFNLPGWLARFQAAGGAWVAIGDRLHLLRPVGDDSTAPLVEELCTLPGAVPALRRALCGEIGA